MKQKSTLLAIIIILLLTSACAPAAPTTAVPTTSPIPEEFTGETAESGVPIELTDALDRQLTFTEPPQRVAIAGRATALLADAVYLFPDAAEKVIAMERRFQSPEPFYPIVDPTFNQVTLLERNASAEQILPTEPDVVIMKTFMAETLGYPLEEIGVQVVYLDLETPLQFSRDIATLGRLFGNPDRAQVIIDYYADHMGLVNDLVSDLEVNNRPTVLLAQYSSQDGEVSIEVPSAAWLQTSLVEMAGGQPIWTEAAPAGGWTVVGFEQIAAWDPDKIFIINYFDDSSQSVQDLVSDPNWASLRAVQEDEIYGFPADFLSWDQPDTRWILGLQWLATKIHPEFTEQIDILAQVNSFFSRMYGLDQGTIEVEIEGRLSGDLP